MTQLTVVVFIRILAIETGLHAHAVLLRIATAPIARGERRARACAAEFCRALRVARQAHAGFRSCQLKVPNGALRDHRVGGGEGGEAGSVCLRVYVCVRVSEMCVYVCVCVCG